MQAQYDLGLVSGATDQKVLGVHQKPDHQISLTHPGSPRSTITQLHSSANIAGPWTERPAGLFTSGDTRTQILNQLLD
jgi:hypothetical protein